MPRVARVRILVESSYLVDLDNQDMVDHAREALVEDIENNVREELSKLHQDIETVLEPGASIDDIEEFLMMHLPNEEESEDLPSAEMLQELSDGQA